VRKPLLACLLDRAYVRDVGQRSQRIPCRAAGNNRPTSER
jgi:hypothetical protein